MPDIGFNIDKTASKESGFLTITLEELESKGIVYLFHKTTGFTRERLRKLLPLDLYKELEWCLEAEIKLQGKQGPLSPFLFRTLHVNWNDSRRLLELLTQSPLIFFNHRPLTIQLYGKTHFYLLIEEEGATLKVSGRLRTNNSDFSLAEVEFFSFGRDPWVIKEAQLYFISSDLDRTLLHLAAYSTLTPEVIQELEEEEEAPEIIFRGNSKERLLQAHQPTPCLVLHDRTGAFADLWMDYGKGGKVALHNHSRHTPNQSLRQRDLEVFWERDLLETDFVRKVVGSSHYYCPLDKVGKSLSFLLELGWQVIDYNSCIVMNAKAPSLSLTSSEFHIQISGKVQYGQYEADLGEVIGAFNRRERFVQLSSGTVGLLPESTVMNNLLDVTQEGELIGREVRLKRSAIGICASLLDHPLVSLDETLTRWKNSQGALDLPTLPSPRFKGELRPYQQEGLNWLGKLYAHQFHGILADDMGLGKTIQAIAFLSLLPEDTKILIVIPFSLLFNWERELEKFLPDAMIYKHHGTQRIQEVNGLPKKGIFLTSYATLRQDIELFMPLFFECVILDEAQAIKNPDAQVSQAVFTLSARFRLSITGTPIENRPEDIWSQFHFLMPEILGTRQQFIADIQAAAVDSRYLTKIRKKIAPFMLRRKKTEVAKELPECIEQTVWVELSPEQRAFYESTLAQMRSGLIKKVREDGLGKHRMEVFEAILRLRQICCHPLLLSQIEETEPPGSSKLDALINDIETAIDEGAKVLIYSQFTSMLALIKKAVQIKGWQYAYLDGATRNREEAVQRFQNCPEISLFLISLKAGGVGLNLTAADYVFLYDPWWNTAAEAQAIHRAHRIGREEKVVAKRYIALETIEEKIMKLKEAKRIIVDSLVEGEFETPQLTEEDLNFLFR